MSAQAIKPLPASAVWFISGCSSGLGASLAKTIIASGHRVIATARNPSSLSYLPDDPSMVLKLPLDVTSDASVSDAFSAAVKHFGRIDVVVNNAGYSIFGDFEAAAASENVRLARDEMETNFWGVVRCTREALHVFREVNPTNGGIGGVIVQVSSMGGRSGYPGQSFYHASKFAIEGLTESISKELLPEWNIQFLILEPGSVKTEYAKGSIKTMDPHPAYQDDNVPSKMLYQYINNPEFSKNWADADVVTKVIFDVVSNKGKEGEKH